LDRHSCELDRHTPAVIAITSTLPAARRGADARCAEARVRCLTASLALTVIGRHK
jgi:hypothetical protein